MYLEHFGLNEAPFRITPHTDFFFAGANRGATLEALLYAITHDEGIVKVSGEVGSGKTMLCRVLMERLPPHVETIHLANPSLSRDEILLTLADELQVNLATNRVSAVMRALQEHLIDLYGQGRQVVVLIDEAHAMPAETLEEIRLLSNLESNRHKLLQIVLFGQPELNEVLGRTEMRQLKERITHNFTLEPLVRGDVAEYIEFRMRAAGYKGPSVFSPAALKLIAGASLGLTRRINILCDKALLAAFAANTHQITPPTSGPPSAMPSSAAPPAPRQALAGRRGRGPADRGGLAFYYQHNSPCIPGQVSPPAGRCRQAIQPQRPQQARLARLITNR
jgi:MSHA biogenesis protein MshM